MFDLEKVSNTYCFYLCFTLQPDDGLRWRAYFWDLFKPPTRQHLRLNFVLRWRIVGQVNVRCVIMQHHERIGRQPAQILDPAQRAIRDERCFLFNPVQFLQSTMYGISDCTNSRHSRNQFDCYFCQPISRGPVSLFWWVIRLIILSCLFWPVCEISWKLMLLWLCEIQLLVGHPLVTNIAMENGHAQFRSCFMMFYVLLNVKIYKWTTFHVHVNQRVKLGEPVSAVLLRIKHGIGTPQP